MIDISVKLDARQLDALQGSARTRASQVIRSAAAGIARSAQVSIQAPKHGRLYGAHRASAPGEAPATDTGMLVNSILARGAGEFTAVVAVHARYGLYLEMGTVHMAARPFLRPAVDKWKPSFLAAMRQICQARLGA